MDVPVLEEYVPALLDSDEFGILEHVVIVVRVIDVCND
jgi:hypothetical protein